MVLSLAWMPLFSRRMKFGGNDTSRPELSRFPLWEQLSRVLQWRSNCDKLVGDPHNFSKLDRTVRAIFNVLALDASVRDLLAEEQFRLASGWTAQWLDHLARRRYVDFDDQISAAFLDVVSQIKSRIEWTEWEQGKLEQCGIEVLQLPDCSFFPGKGRYCAE